MPDLLRRLRELGDCEDCRRRREAFVAASKRMAEWIKNPIGTRPPDPINPDPIPSQPNRLPNAAPTSQAKTGRVDPRGRPRD